MAADLTLLALPATPRHWRWAQLATYRDTFLDDEILTLEGEVVGFIDGASREAWTHRLYDHVDILGVGPLSLVKATTDGDERWLPAPTVAIANYWAAPRTVTRCGIVETMVRMNLPDRSHYRQWRRDRPRGYKVGRQYARAMRGYRRVARRQDVKRWLAAHAGWIVWAEVW